VQYFDWSYELTDYVDNGVTVAFDSFMIDDDSLEPGDLRLLAVDSYLVLPVNTSIRLLISSTDVINLTTTFYVFLCRPYSKLYP
jgi:heme/copper-type cytochrome/quinol oxidase subunit 2